MAESGISSEIPRASTDDGQEPVWTGDGPTITGNELSEAGRDSLLEALKKVREYESVITEKDRYINQLQKSIKELAKQLKGVAEFIDMREDIEERLDAMEKFHREEIFKFKTQAREARLDMLENKVSLRREEAVLKQNHERDVAIKATELLDKRTREVNDQNFELVKDKLLMARDMEMARSQCAVLTSENATLRRKAQLATGAESELLIRSVAQKKQIVLLKKQIKTTEENIEKIVQEYDQRLSKQEKQYTKMLREVTEQRDSARHDALVLRTDLKKLRDASAKVANLHTDLQLFFHEALRDVRLEVLEERRRAIATSPCGTTNKAVNTSSSALRLESQPRLMITDVFGTLSRNRSEWTTDKKGFPVLVSKNSGPSGLLPPIPSDTASFDTTISSHIKTESGGKLEPAGFLRCVRDLDVPGVASSTENSQDMWGATGEGAGEDENVELDDMMRYKNPHSVPSAPSLTDLQQIDIRQLTWSEKERVIYYLFKRLQQVSGSRRYVEQHNSSNTSKDAAEMGPSATFLTQQS